jgi:hypothetical protein
MLAIALENRANPFRSRLWGLPRPQVWDSTTQAGQARAPTDFPCKDGEP